MSNVFWVSQATQLAEEELQSQHANLRSKCSDLKTQLDSAQHELLSQQSKSEKLQGQLTQRTEVAESLQLRLDAATTDYNRVSQVCTGWAVYTPCCNMLALSGAVLITTTTPQVHHASSLCNDCACFT